MAKFKDTSKGQEHPINITPNRFHMGTARLTARQDTMPHCHVRSTDRYLEVVCSPTGQAVVGCTASRLHHLPPSCGGRLQARSLPGIPANWESASIVGSFTLSIHRSVGGMSTSLVELLQYVRQPGIWESMRQLSKRCGASVAPVFCTSRAAIHAGSAQVSLRNLWESLYQEGGKTPKPNTKTKPTHQSKTDQQKHKDGDSLLKVSVHAYWGSPLWRPCNPLRFWRLVLGPSMDKIFARVVIRLAASHCP